MKRCKRMILLTAVLAVLCAVCIGMQNFELKKEQIRQTDAVILSVDPAAVTKLSWSYDETELAFSQGEQWTYDSDPAFPVDPDKLEDTLQVFRSLGAAFVITSPEDVSQYGLDTPVCTIRMETSDRAYKILLGNFSQLDSQRYVSIGDGNVYLVKEDPMDSFQTVLSSYILHDEIPVFYDVTDLAFEGEENYAVYTSEDDSLSICTEDRYYTDRGGIALPLETVNVTSCLNTLQRLTLSDYASYNASEEELAAFGLAEPELTGQITWRTENGDVQTFIYHLGRDQEELKNAQEDETAAVTCYFRVGESQIVYRISQTQYGSLMAVSYDDLRHDEVMTAAFDDVVSMDIMLEGTQYTITSEKEDDTRRFFYQEEELEELQLSTLRTAVRSMRADSYTDAAPEGKEEIRIVYHLDNDFHPELEIVLYRQDGSLCLATVDGQSVCLVSRSSVVDLIEAVNSIILG